jgi:hypothetical protein
VHAQMCRECEQYGMASSKLLEFNTPEEAEEVEEIFNNAIQCLSEEDRALGPVTRMLPMLKKVGKGQVLTLAVEALEFASEMSMMHDATTA